MAIASTRQSTGAPGRDVVYADQRAKNCDQIHHADVGLVP
jgi:hypothetical protein